MNAKRGFTLVELMVVIAIVGLLAAVLLPQVGGMVEKGRVSKALAQYDSLRTASVSYFSDVGAWPTRGVIDGAINQLLTNGAAVVNWQGPYSDRPATRPSDGRFTHPWGGIMMLYDVNDGVGNDPTDFNGNGITPDRHVVLAQVLPGTPIPAFSLTAMDVQIDGSAGATGKVTQNPPGLAAGSIAIVFSEGT